MKEHDIVQLKADYEFEAIDDNDNPIGMKVIPAGTKCTIVSMTSADNGYVTVEFSKEDWKEEWGAFDVLDIPIFEVPLEVIPLKGDMTMSKLETLAEVVGLTINEMFEKAIFDGTCPGICTNLGCNYTTNVEPDCSKGYCEACKTQTVKSCLVLAGLI